MHTKPSETEYVVQWFDPNQGWADLEGAETETEAHRAARRFIEQDAALGASNRYRVVAISVVEIVSEEEAAAARDERDGFTAPAVTLTPASLDLFLGLAEDAPNWSGTPLVTVTPAQRGNLADLKKKGLIETWIDEGCAFAVFTDAGVALAVAHGFDAELLRHP